MTYLPITQNGQPLKKVADLKEGETGFVANHRVTGDGIAPDAPVWPSPAGVLYDCFHVTRTKDGLDLAFVSGDARDVEACVYAPSLREFDAVVTGFQEKGWNIDTDSIRVTLSGAAFAVMRVTRTGDDELDVAFVSAASIPVTHWDEYLVHEDSRPTFRGAVRHMQQDGWSITPGSIKILPDTDGDNYIVVMRKRK